MNSLRIKLTLALLAMSFIAIAVAGLTSRTLVLSRFDDLVVERAAIGFENEVLAYYQAFGSWEAAVASESFFQFVARLRPQAFEGPDGPVTPLNEASAPGGEAPQQRRDFEFGGEPPPFAVTDMQGRAVLPLADQVVGDMLDPELLEFAYPLELDGEVIGLAVPLRRPALTELEEQYLSAIEDSWILSLGLAGLLAIPFGLYLGRWLTVPVRELTDAIRLMGQGDLNQQVPVRSKDELGTLSEGFNQMSVDLARAHLALEASREQISKQAVILEELSRQDDLTGLMNRRAFDDEVGKLFKRAVRYEHPLSLAMADIDHFKQINDTYTHAVGDQVLRALAGLLRKTFRETDLVSRYGGEEFAIAFPETPLAQAGSLAEKLRQATQEYDWRQIHPDLAVTVSVGVSERDGSGAFEQVLQRADTWLYDAKASGRNQVRF